MASSNNSATGNLLTGFLVAVLICVLIAVVGGVIFLISRRRGKRTAMMDAQPYYGDYGQPIVPNGLQVPPGFGYDTQRFVEGQPLMGAYPVPMQGSFAMPMQGGYY